MTMEIKTLKKNGVFRLAGKSFFLTYPNCPLERAYAFELLVDKNTDKPQYAKICRELHESGEWHLHVLLMFAKKKDIKNARFWDIGGYHGDYRVPRDTDDVLKYISKDDLTPMEHGMYLSNNQSAVQKRALQNKVLLETDTKDLVLQGLIPLCQFTLIDNAKTEMKLRMIEVPSYMPKVNYWIVGAPGIGKSRWIMETYGTTIYRKQQNKWWCGYAGQRVVVIDDFDMVGACLGHYMKTWPDVYPYTGETKGGRVTPVLDSFHVTSNYTIAQIFCHQKDQEKWDEQLVGAIERRFQMKTIVDGKLVDYPYWG